MAERSVQLKAVTGVIGALLLAACVPPDLGAPEPKTRAPVSRPEPLPVPAPTTPLPPPVELPTPGPGAVEPPPPPVRTVPPVSAAGASLLSESRAHQAAGRYELAAASIERALRIEPRQPILWLELGDLRLREGDYAQAESLGRRALSLAVGDPTIEARAEKLISDARRR